MFGTSIFKIMIFFTDIPTYILLVNIPKLIVWNFPVQIRDIYKTNVIKTFFFINMWKLTKFLRISAKEMLICNYLEKDQEKGPESDNALCVSNLINYMPI